jgi:serpin B
MKSHVSGPRSALTTVVLAALAVTACGSSTAHPAAGSPASAEPVVATVPATSAQVVAADDAFAVNLLAQLSGGDVVMSPLSIATALQMALQGAGGETAAQMRSVLQLADNASAADGAKQLATSLAKVAAPTQLSLANTIWLQKGLTLQPTFATTMSSDYAAGLKRADFIHSAAQVTDAINKTISDQTRGKIPTLFGPGSIDSTTRLVLANAVYLKATWGTPFQVSATTSAPFQLADGTSVSVPTMNETEALGYRQAAGYQAVTLPYSDGQLAMTIVLPTGSLQTLEKSLTGSTLATMLTPGSMTGVHLSLPKFSFSSQFDLGSTLQKLGMTDAFGNADFSGITSTPLYISSVVHKAVIDVDENGTEAAAATGVAFAASAIMAGSQVNVDRPFLFAITDTATGAPLFLGTVANPAATG